MREQSTYSEPVYTSAAARDCAQRAEYFGDCHRFRLFTLDNGASWIVADADRRSLREMSTLPYSVCFVVTGAPSRYSALTQWARLYPGYLEYFYIEYPLINR